MRAALPSLSAIVFVLVAGGCAPIVNIEGSFFPAWLLCLLLGLVVTAALRPVLARSGLEPHLGPLLLVYPCLCLFLTFSIWLVFYRS
jgi:hypothetical protein